MFFLGASFYRYRKKSLATVTKQIAVTIRGDRRKEDAKTSHLFVTRAAHWAEETQKCQECGIQACAACQSDGICFDCQERSTTSHIRILNKSHYLDYPCAHCKNVSRTVYQCEDCERWFCRQCLFNDKHVETSSLGFYLTHGSDVWRMARFSVSHAAMTFFVGSANIHAGLKFTELKKKPFHRLLTNDVVRCFFCTLEPLCEHRGGRFIFFCKVPEFQYAIVTESETRTLPIDFDKALIERGHL